MSEKKLTEKSYLSVSNMPDDIDAYSAAGGSEEVSKGYDAEDDER